ncbi:MAG: penicillin-binding protein activator [Gammaproteobacteria bacterium]|nr:penicillin-binding protein activator [Gammaproteobacteria bacterium]MDE2346251.1 penicillin-binding protein activator [Gammaproteobacteria bacterium]
MQDKPVPYPVRWLCLPLAVLLASCAIPPTVQTPQSQATQANNLEQQGKFTAAAQIFASLATTAQGDQRNEYLVSAAEDWWQARQNQNAWKLLGQLQGQTLSPVLNARVELLKASMDFAAQQPQAALKHLQFPLQSLPDVLQAKILLLRSQVHAAMNNSVAAVQDLSKRESLLAGNTAAIEDNHQRIWNLISQNGTAINIQSLPKNISPVVRGWLQLGLLSRNLWQQPQYLLQQLQAWQAEYPDHPANLDIVPDLIAKQQAFVTYPTQVAVLLPLTGTYQSAADAIRDGILAAYFQLSQSAHAPVVRFYDSGATAAGARAAYRRAVAAGADMIIGPLIKDAVNGVASLGTLAVPVLALNDLDTGQVAPPMLFQFGLPPEDEARQVAERLFVANLMRGVALVPASDWGKRVLNAFTSRFEQLGGSLLGSQTYPPGASDFSISITRLLNLDQSQYRKDQLSALLGVHLQFEPRRRRDIQFIFLASDPADAKLIRPQLQYYHAINVPVYSVSQVYQPGEPPDPDLDGITFDDMPWTLEAAGATASISKNVAALWPNNFSANGRLYALGFDAWRLVPLLFKGRGFNMPVQGMTGLLTMDSTGRVYRQLDWASFKNGVPVMLAPLSTPPAPAPVASAPPP